MRNKKSIRINKLKKIYPRATFDMLTNVIFSAFGRPQEKILGGLALSELTLSIREGERVGIIGRNGAGKSTLLQILAGIIDQTSGTFEINGNITAVLTLGIGLQEDLSGRENIYLDGVAHGKTKKEIEKNVKKIVDFADLGKFIDLPLKTYSTGMKARLAFSIVTHIDPEILIIDETLSVGDANFSLKANRKIKELCSKGSIVIIVSHSLASIRELCNRCLWLDEGKLIMDGPPDIVTKKYQDLVKSTDEQDHLNKFKNLIKNNTFDENFKIKEFYLSSSKTRISKLESGQSLVVNFEWTYNKDDLSHFNFSCLRLDEILIFENIIFLKKSKKKLILTFSNFNLSPGIYRFQIEAINFTGKIIAIASSILEVKSNDVPSGGRPILLKQGFVDIY